MPVAHVAIRGSGAPVHGSTLEALIATAAKRRLVEPALCLAGSCVHQVQGVGIVVLCGKVCLTSVATSLVEVPAGDDVGLCVEGCQVDVLGHGHNLAAAGLAVAPVGEGNKALILVSIELHGSASLVHVLAVHHRGLGADGHHVVARAVNGQLQLVGLHGLEVSGQRLVAVHSVLELSLGGNLLTGGVRPVDEVEAEVLGGGECHLTALLILVSLRVDVDAAGSLGSYGGSQSVLVDIGNGTVYLTIDAAVGKTTGLVISQARRSVEVEAFAGSEGGLLCLGEVDDNLVDKVTEDRLPLSFLLSIIPVGTACSEGAQSLCLTIVAHFGGDDNAILLVSSEALDVQFNLRRGEGQAFGGLHEPVGLHILACEGDELQSIVRILATRACCHGSVSRSIFE